MEVIAVRTRCMGTISAQHAFIYHEMSKNMWCVCFVMHFLCYAVTFFSILCNTDGNIFHIYNIYGSDLSVANKLNNLRGMIFWKNIYFVDVSNEFNSPGSSIWFHRTLFVFIIISIILSWFGKHPNRIYT